MRELLQNMADRGGVEQGFFLQHYYRTNAPDPTDWNVMRVPLTTVPLSKTCLTPPSPGTMTSLRFILVVLYSRLVAITNVCDPTVHTPTSTFPKVICVIVALDAKRNGVMEGSDSAKAEAEDLISEVVGSVQGIIPSAPWLMDNIVYRSGYSMSSVA